MEVVYDDRDLETYLRDAVQASNERPVLIDRFLKDAAEVDVDVVSDGRDVVVGGVMEHIEEAGSRSQVGQPIELLSTPRAKHRVHR